MSGGVISIIMFLGLIISYGVCLLAYDKKWAMFFRYLPPIYGFFMGIILEKFAKITDSPPQYIKAAIGMMLIGWGFWFFAWLDIWDKNRREKQNKIDDASD